jgi:hypothetical protein
MNLLSVICTHIKKLIIYEELYLNFKFKLMLNLNEF